MQIQSIKLIKNALIWLILLTSLNGCSSNIKPLNVQTQAVERTPLNLSSPPALVLQPVVWKVVTPQNASTVFDDMKQKGEMPVVFATTGEGYQNLAIDWSKVRAYMESQNLIIIQYKDYYEPTKKDNK